MITNSYQKFIKRWLAWAYKDIDGRIRSAMINQNLKPSLIKLRLATLKIQEFPGNNEKNFAAVWIYVHKGKETPFLRIEWHGYGFRMFENPPKDRKQRRKEEREETKVVDISSAKPIITDASLDDIEIEARAQEYLEQEKKHPSTTTDKLKD